MKLPRRHSQRGFTLLEVLLAIGISLALGAAALTDLRRDNESKQAMAVGQQLETVGKAVNTYLALHYTQIVALANVAGAGSSGDPGPRQCTLNAGTSPFGGGTASICTITTDTLVRSGLLPVSFSGRNAFGAQYNIYIRVTGTTNPIVDGMVITDTPYTTGGGVRYDLLGQAMQVAGADSGMTRTVANTLEGLNGTWRDEAWPSVTHNGVTYPGLNARGLLGYRSGYGSSGFAAYLRLDGTTPMTGTLDMATHDIENVNNLEANRLLVKNQIQLNVDGSDAATSTDRTDMIAGSGVLEVRNNNGVNFRNLDGSAGANVKTGHLTADGSLEVRGTAGNNGDITASHNIIAGQDLTVNGRAAIGNGLNIIGGGASITGNTTVDGNVTLGGTSTMTAYNVVAANTVRVGTYEMTAGGLRDTSNPANTWFYDNSVTAWRSTSNLQVDGETRTNRLGVDTTAMIGQSLEITGSVVAMGDQAVTPGNACAVNGTLRRGTNGMLVQCNNGYWQSNGLQTIAPVTVQVRQNVNGGQNSGTATCPPNSKLVAGGYRLVVRVNGGGPGEGGLDSASPASSYPNGNGWTVATGEDNGAGTTFEAIAMCSR